MFGHVGSFLRSWIFLRSNTTEIVAQTILPLAAAGYSRVHLLAGGGFFGAIVIFIIAKVIGRYGPPKKRVR